MSVLRASAALATAALAAALAGCGAPEQVLGDSWQGSPTTPRGLEYMPQRAQRLGIEGWAAVRCVATAQQTATDCAVLGEWPADMGMGAAALKLSANITTQHTFTPGVPPPKPGGEIILPVTFCQAQGSQCAAVQAERDAFIERARRAQHLANHDDCPGARAIAADLAQPGLIQDIATRCRWR